MEEATFIIEPLQSENLQIFWVALVVALATLTILIWLLRQKKEYEERTRQLLLAMLIFFGFLMASGTAFFSLWAHLKIGPVQIYPSAVDTSFGKASFADIQRVYFHEDRQPSLVNPNLARKTVRMLIIEEQSGKTHVLSEENYDLNSVMQRLQQAIEEYQGSVKKTK